MSIIIFIISLAILILVHEFGHFIVAKKSGIRVDEFGLGFPPRLLAKKWGDTTYTINAIPFGGFVKIFGEDPIGDEDTLRALAVSNGASPHSDSFQYKPKWIQALVLVAGVTMNLIFAWLLISLGFMIGLPTPVDAGLGKVTDAHLVVTEILPGSPAENAGLQAGDVIVSASTGNELLQNENLTPENVSNMIAESTTKNLEITYERGNSEPTTVSIEPNTNTVVGKRAVGIGMDIIGTLKLNLPSALSEGAKTTWFLTKGTVVGLGTFIWNIINFKADFSQVAGPVGIAGTFSQARTLGFVFVLSLVALISINLAVINLLPFPALDGGRLFFILIEVIIRKPIPPKTVRYANTVGFALLLLLMLVVTSHDILKLL
jgi:regulator of sigma E protease